ncbi:MAG: ABC transporter permease [Micropruina sp.]
MLRDPKIMVGSVIALVVVLMAVLGPLLAPYGENEIVGKPFTMEGGPLGTDYLGQDVFSRVLYGGQSVLIIAVLATVLGVALGLVVGVTAAYVGGWLDEVLMRGNDVLLAFPQILIALVVLSAVEQPTWWMIVLLVGIAHAPRVARVARGVALSYVNNDFVTAAEAIGEPAGGSPSSSSARTWWCRCWPRPACGSPTRSAPSPRSASWVSPATRTRPTGDR